MQPKRKLLYIMSPSYSGSTLLTRLLGKYQDISTIGELKATGISDIDTYQCACGELFLNCGFWQNLAETLKPQGVELNLRDLRTRVHSDSALYNLFLKPNLRGDFLEMLRTLAFKCVPGAQAEFTDFLKRCEAIIDEICRQQGGEVFLDESKDPLRALYFGDSGLWDFRVVRLVRDGRGAVNSDIRHNQRDISLACKEWNLKIDEMARFEEMRDTAVLKVSYEQLCLEPDATLNKILDFADVANRNMRDPGELEHIIGNDMRLKPMREVSLDEKWRKDLSASQLEAFYRLSGDRNTQLGYGD